MTIYKVMIVFLVIEMFYKLYKNINFYVKINKVFYYLKKKIIIYLN